MQLIYGDLLTVEVICDFSQKPFVLFFFLKKKRRGCMSTFLFWFFILKKEFALPSTATLNKENKHIRELILVLDTRHKK